MCEVLCVHVFAALVLVGMNVCRYMPVMHVCIGVYALVHLCSILRRASTMLYLHLYVYIHLVHTHIGMCLCMQSYDELMYEPTTSIRVH